MNDPLMSKEWCSQSGLMRESLEKITSSCVGSWRTEDQWSAVLQPGSRNFCSFRGPSTASKLEKSVFA